MASSAGKARRASVICRWIRYAGGVGSTSARSPSGSMCLAMALLETAQEVSRHACQPDAPDPPIVLRLLTCGKAGTDEVIDQAARRRARSADRGGDLTDRGVAAVGDVMHRHELGERQLAPPG